MRKQPIYEIWKYEIEQYCIDSGLDYAKLRKMMRCFDDKSVIYQYPDPEKGKNGLLDETPAAIVLIMRIVDGKPVFEQTENTLKHLSQ